MLRLLWLLFVVTVGAKSRETNLNNPFDIVLKKIGQKLGDENGGYQNLSIAFERAYPYTFLWGGVTVTPKLYCDQAWLGDISTILRSENAKMVSKNGTLFLSAGVGLGTMKFGFDACDLRLEPLGTFMRTKFAGSVGNNSLLVELNFRLQKEGACEARLDRLSVVRAEKVNIQTGHNLIDRTRDEIFTLLVQFFHDDFLHIITIELNNYVKQIVESSHFCQGLFYHVKSFMV